MAHAVAARWRHPGAILAGNAAATPGSARRLGCDAPQFPSSVRPAGSHAETADGVADELRADDQAQNGHDGGVVLSHSVPQGSQDLAGPVAEGEDARGRADREQGVLRIAPDRTARVPTAFGGLKRSIEPIHFGASTSCPWLGRARH
jgi:hypothetical protein